MKRVLLLLLFIGLGSSVRSQILGCAGASTLTPTNYYYSGTPTSVTTSFAGIRAILYLCADAVVYDTAVWGDRQVMINAGAVYYAGASGFSYSSYYVKSYGTLVLTNHLNVTGAKDIYVEGGATVVDPYGYLGTGWTVVYFCSPITFPASGCMVGINELSGGISGLTISPNPTTGKIRIQLREEDQAAGNAEIRITDLVGKELKRERLREEMDISSLPAGLYIVQLTDGKLLPLVKRLVKTN